MVSFITGDNYPIRHSLFNFSAVGRYSGDKFLFFSFRHEWPEKKVSMTILSVTVFLTYALSDLNSQMSVLIFFKLHFKIKIT